MRADFHIHTNFSADSIISLDFLIDRVMKKNLDCIAITDHNTIAGAKELLKRKPPFQVIIGEEISTDSGEIIGLFLDFPIPAGLDINKTISMIKEQGGFVSIPHPCDRLRHRAVPLAILEDIVSDIDFIEGFNGRTVFRKDDLTAYYLAKEFAKPVIAGSDSHTPWELGNCGMIIDPFHSVLELPARLENGVVFGKRTTPFTHLVTKSVKYMAKTRLLKNSKKGIR